MLRLIAALTLALYTALGPGANPAQADAAAAEALKGEALKKLVFSEPRPLPEVAFADAGGVEKRLSDWRGQWLLVNFWATWCVPCRVEMPALDRLQAELGGERFAVLTIAAGRNPPPAVDSFFAEAGVENLPKLFDPKMQLAGQMGVMGLPVSVLVNPEGQEVARLIGDADWASAEARALIAALIAG